MILGEIEVPDLRCVPCRHRLEGQPPLDVDIVAATATVFIQAVNAGLSVTPAVREDPETF